MGRAKEAAGPALVWDSILPPGAAAEVGEQAEAVSPNSGLNQAGRECWGWKGLTGNKTTCEESSTGVEG